MKTYDTTTSEFYLYGKAGLLPKEIYLQYLPVSAVRSQVIFDPDSKNSLQQIVISMLKNLSKDR